jgi:hypothetical protein
MTFRPFALAAVVALAGCASSGSNYAACQAQFPIAPGASYEERTAAVMNQDACFAKLERPKQEFAAGFMRGFAQGMYYSPPSYYSHTYYPRRRG